MIYEGSIADSQRQPSIINISTIIWIYFLQRRGCKWRGIEYKFLSAFSFSFLSVMSLKCKLEIKKLFLCLKYILVIPNIVYLDYIYGLCHYSKYAIRFNCCIYTVFMVVIKIFIYETFTLNQIMKNN